MATDLSERRDKLFACYERGMFTDTDVKISFVSLLAEAPDDETALSLSDCLPHWFRTSFREWLCELAERDYLYEWFAMEDMRTAEQRELDSLRHQATLNRLAAELLERL